MTKNHHEQSNQTPAPRHRPYLFILILIIGIGIALARIPFIIVLKNQSGSFLASAYKLQEDDFSHPRLKLLRQKEHLDKITASATSQFEAILLLRKWAHDQWKEEGSFYYPAWDAEEILELVRNYRNCGFCAQHAIVFLQACQAMGIHARYVEPPGHFIVGVWSDDFNKWVLMDPSTDTHFERGGIPLSGRRISEAYWNNDIKGILKSNSNGNTTRATKNDLKPYRLFSIVERADQLTRPPMIQVNDGPWRELKREQNYKNYPFIGRDKLTIGSPYLAWKGAVSTETYKDRPLSDDPDDFAYVMNQSLIFIARSNDKKGLLKLVLFPENSPTFQKFLVNLDYSGWQETDSRDVMWILKPGLNHLSARIKTKYGWRGPPSQLTVYYKPNFFAKLQEKPTHTHN